MRLASVEDEGAGKAQRNKLLEGRPPERKKVLNRENSNVDSDWKRWASGTGRIGERHGRVNIECSERAWALPVLTQVP